MTLGQITRQGAWVAGGIAGIRRNAAAFGVRHHDKNLKPVVVGLGLVDRSKVVVEMQTLARDLDAVDAWIDSEITGLKSFQDVRQYRLDLLRCAVHSESSVSLLGTRLFDNDTNGLECLIQLLDHVVSVSPKNLKPVLGAFWLVGVDLPVDEDSITEVFNLDGGLGVVGLGHDGLSCSGWSHYVP